MRMRGGKILGWTASMALLLAIGGVGDLPAHADGAVVASSPESASAGPQQVSIWDRPVAGTDVTYGELTVERRGGDDDIEPILLPLPTPALAAGVGLGIAYVLRRRFSRR